MSVGVQAGIVVLALVLIVAAGGIATWYRCPTALPCMPTAETAARDQFEEDEARRNTVGMELNPLANRQATPPTMASSTTATTVNPTFAGPPGVVYTEADPNQPAVYYALGGTYVQPDSQQPGMYDAAKTEYAEIDEVAEEGGAVQQQQQPPPPPQQKKQHRGKGAAKGGTGATGKCARGDTGGRACSKPVAAGQVYCDGHSCPSKGCGNSKSSSDAACHAHSGRALLLLDTEGYVVDGRSPVAGAGAGGAGSAGGAGGVRSDGIVYATPVDDVNSSSM